MPPGAEKPVGLGYGEPAFPPLPVEWGDTVHLDVVDRFGNMFAATPSGGWLQSSPAIPELGFSISTRGQMGWLEPGHPSTVRPNARPRTTLTPTLALRDAQPYLAWGSPGGDQQDQWITQFFLRHVHANMNLQEAIDAPAWHSAHLIASFWPRQPQLGSLVVEGRIAPDVVAELRERVGESDVSVDLDRLPSRNVAGLKAALSAQDARYALLSDQRTLCAINQVMASDSSRITDDDEVAFFPPVTGG